MTTGRINQVANMKHRPMPSEAKLTLITAKGKSNIETTFVKQ